MGPGGDRQSLSVSYFLLLGIIITINLQSTFTSYLIPCDLHTNPIHPEGHFIKEGDEVHRVQISHLEYKTMLQEPVATIWVKACVKGE